MTGVCEQLKVLIGMNVEFEERNNSRNGTYVIKNLSQGLDKYSQ